MKLLHAADLLLGQGFAQVPKLASALREARLEAVQSLMALARREQVQAIVLAGNTLADIRVAHEVVAKLSSLLATSPVPVYLRPGERDPWCADSPYVLRADLFRPPVHILREPRLPWEGPLAAVGSPLEGAEYVAMAGSSSCRKTPPQHWSGPAEAYDFGQELGTVNLVTFPECEVRQLPVGRLRWLKIERDSLAGLIQELTPLASETTLVHLTLKGQATLEEWHQFDAWRSVQRFQWLEVDNQLRLNDDAQRFRHPLLRAIQTRLQGQSGALVSLHELVAQSGKEDLV